MAPTSTQYEPGAQVSGDVIPLCVPEIHGNEWKYIKECLDTNWVSSVGSYVTRFECELADYIGTQYAIAMSSGTTALHIALLVSGVQPDDEVLVPTLTFIAPANAIRYAQAWPVFIDVEPDYWQIDPQHISDFLEKECRWQNGELRNKTTGHRVKAIIPVDLLGHPVDMLPIVETARKYNLSIIEDSTESLGAKYRGERLGNHADIACFSFNGNKIITTGGGGMLTTNNETWARKARYLTTQAKDDPLEYIHNEVGYNYRMTNLLAALGCAQLEQLENYIAAKRRIAATYKAALSAVQGIDPMPEADWAYSIYWMYTVLVDADKYGMDSRTLLARLREVGILSRPLWQPMHRSPAHRNLPCYGGAVADRLNRDALSLPCSVGLTEAQQERVIEVLQNGVL
ncbi:MAG: LegC family aminotransferase [Anaerolineae bacterium]|nr:LegC family aminotransferase [Anaerolineae bacterium]